MAADEAVLAMCGPCRHFEQALSGRHRCQLGLVLLDGVARTTCTSFHPFALGEGSVFEQSDCCAREPGRAHTHTDERAV
ncbi:MAG TPA: hypothetical protein VGR28_10300 [Candidatus Thermoplasmatota archaeon]|nr:hypothetical protein [Candidatus Thermoplasmatota archaeon]